MYIYIYTYIHIYYIHIHIIHMYIHIQLSICIAGPPLPIAVNGGMNPKLFANSIIIEFNLKFYSF